MRIKKKTMQDIYNKLDEKQLILEQEISNEKEMTLIKEYQREFILDIMSSLLNISKRSKEIL